MSSKISSIKRQICIGGFVLTVLFLIAAAQPAEPSRAPSQSASCDIFRTGSFQAESSLALSLECDAPTQLYFGVCDSGGVGGDDRLSVLFNGGEIASNFFFNGAEETDIGSTTVAAGSHTVTVTSLNTDVGFATYSVAVTPDIGALAEYLLARCGSDFIEPNIIGGECSRAVPVFLTDPAPMAGTLRLKSRFGMLNREEGITLKEWSINAGDRVNNAVVNMPGPDYARLWWQPAGSSEWQLLPSQYWHGGGSASSEYGIDCNENMSTPSYHSAFSKAIPASEVPLLKR